MPLAIAAALLISAPSAISGFADEPDPIAPPGAPPHWLPSDNWVMEHWLPFDHRDLLAELGLEYRELVSSIGGSDETTIADLARAAGRSPRALGRRLVAGWRGRVSDRQLRVLGRRTRITLANSHLSKHMLGHLFHVRSRLQATERIFGAPAPEVNRLHAAGHSYCEIGEMFGRSRETVRRETAQTLRAGLRRGVRERQTPRAWSRHLLGLQRAALPRYLGNELGRR